VMNLIMESPQAPEPEPEPPPPPRTRSVTGKSANTK
jgi:lipopolysaccharide export system protein LptC